MAETETAFSTLNSAVLKRLLKSAASLQYLSVLMRNKQKHWREKAEKPPACHKSVEIIGCFVGTGMCNLPRVCGFIGLVQRAWSGEQVEGLVTLRCWCSCGCVTLKGQMHSVCLLMEDAKGWSSINSCDLSSQFQGREIVIVTTRIFSVLKWALLLFPTLFPETTWAGSQFHTYSLFLFNVELIGAACLEVPGPWSIPMMLVPLWQEPSWNPKHHLREEEASELSEGLSDLRQVLEFSTYLWEPLMAVSKIQELLEVLYALCMGQAWSSQGPQRALLSWAQSVIYGVVQLQCEINPSLLLSSVSCSTPLCGTYWWDPALL